MAERTASLQPRGLVGTWRCSCDWCRRGHGVGLLALSWRIGGVASDRLVIPVTFILSAPVFLWLYEVSMRNEIWVRPVASGDERTARPETRRVRQILLVEVILVTGLMGVGHALLGLDWSAKACKRAWASSPARSSASSAAPSRWLRISTGGGIAQWARPRTNGNPTA